MANMTDLSQQEYDWRRRLSHIDKTDSTWENMTDGDDLVTTTPDTTLDFVWDYPRELVPEW